MISSFLDLFKKEHWAYVKKIDHPVTITGVAGSRDETLYIHLYESSRGRRKYELSLSCSGFTDDKLEKFFPTTPIYNNQIRRWLAGRHDPEIPVYSQLGEEDTANALRGKI